MYTFAEKILAAKAGLSHTMAGQIVEVTPDLVLSHDNTAPILDIFHRMGAVTVYDPKMHAVVLDHATPPPTTRHAENHRIIRAFIKDQKIRNFFDVGYGICHQVIVEEGLALPGDLILGSDSHTPHAGVMGAFAAGIGRTEMASIWALGKIWLRVPESLKIILHGKFMPGVGTKDLALQILGDIGADGGLYKSIEWHGSGLSGITLDQRAVLTNMMAEAGAKNSYIPPDKSVFDYLDGRSKKIYQPVYPDSDAIYSREIDYNLEDIEPMVACPHTVDNVKPISELKDVPIHQAFLGTCTNGRLEDIKSAAGIMSGNKVNKNTRMIVIPASKKIYADALRLGYLEIFLEAGAVIESPGCGPCMGNHMGVPAIGEVTISSANRNFKGRMGTKESEIYLASPMVVAASAIAGRIIHPVDLGAPENI